MKITIELPESMAAEFQQHLVEVQKEMPWCDPQKLALWAINYYLEREGKTTLPLTVERDPYAEYDEFAFEEGEEA